MTLSDRLKAIDTLQQRHRRLAFVVGVYKKFNDDNGGSLAALMSYYAFVSIFPLLLVFVTILGFVIHGNPAEQQKVLDGALGQIPLLKDPLKTSSLQGSGSALAIGVVGSLLAGMGITSTTQNALNQIWHVPHKRRPNFLLIRARGLGTLTILGALFIISTAVAGFTTARSNGAVADVASILIALAVNLVLFYTAFRLLTAVELPLRDLWPGVVAGAIVWQIMQHLGGLWAKKVAHQESLYGTFGLVLGLLAFLYLGAMVFVFAAELNATRANRLWPRSLFPPPLTAADQRALTGIAEIEERSSHENVEVTFDDNPHAAAAARPSRPRPSRRRPAQPQVRSKTRAMRAKSSTPRQTARPEAPPSAPRRPPPQRSETRKQGAILAYETLPTWESFKPWKP